MTWKSCLKVAFVIFYFLVSSQLTNGMHCSISTGIHTERPSCGYENQYGVAARAWWAAL